MAAEQAQPVLLHHAMPIKVIWVIQSYNTSMHSMHDDVLPNFQKTKASAARTILLPALAGWASLHQNKKNSACLVSPFKVTPFLGHEFKQPLKLKPTEVYTEIASGASFLFLLFSFLFHLPDSKSFRTSYALSISFTDLLVPVLLTTFSSANMASASSKHDKIPTFLHNLAVYTQSWRHARAVHVFGAE